MSRSNDERGGRAVRVERALKRASVRHLKRQRERAANAERFEWIEKEGAQVGPFYNGWRARAGNDMGESEGPRATLAQAVDRARDAKARRLEG